VNPVATFVPSAGTQSDTYRLDVQGFRPGRTLDVALTRPDGVVEHYAIDTDSAGAGELTFPHVSAPITGMYTANILDPGTQDHATATTTVSPG
jgi:hypothetical protein